MTEIWVYKADGTIQCQPARETEVTLAAMREQLAKLIGASNILDEAKWPPRGPVPTICGRPTGNLNAYKITPEGLHLLYSGVDGPSGFDVDPNTKIMLDPNDPVAPFPFKGDGDGPIFPWPTDAKGLSDDRLVPWPWVAITAGTADEASRAVANVIASLTQVGTTPTHITELIGRQCRVYNEGDAINFDYFAQRVNVVLEGGRISRIWFG